MFGSSSWTFARAGAAVAAAVVGAALSGGVARADKPAAAAPPPPAAARPGAPIPGDGRTPDQLRGEVLERMRALRAWRIVEALRLDEATSARLFPILSKYDEREMGLAIDRRDIARSLRAEVQSARPDEARIKTSIDRLLANRERQRAMEDERVKDLRKVLTPVQQAKLMLLLPRLENEFARRVRQAAEEQRQLGGGNDDASL
jgi:Spy/CpxP family protein refolding chaperone